MASIMSAQNLQEQIKNLEKSVIRCDIPAMSRIITALHEDWDSVPEKEQQDIMKLEAIFFTLISMHVQGTA